MFVRPCLGTGDGGRKQAIVFERGFIQHTCNVYNIFHLFALFSEIIVNPQPFFCNDFKCKLVIL